MRSRLVVLGACFAATACGEAGGSERPLAVIGDAGAMGTDGAACRFEASATLSEVIPTVAVVTWSTTLDPVTSASIEFGLDTAHGMAAPVDLAAPNGRTVLVGMKPERLYHFRVVARSGEEECRSRDFTLTTGALDEDLVPVTSTALAPGARAGGFLVSGFLTNGPAFILDSDGDYVWAYGSGEMGRVALSRDRKYVWYAGVNVAGGRGSMKRVSLDGTEVDDFSAEFGDIHHDFTILPDETIGFLEHDGETDRVMERAPDGSVREVFDVGEAQGGVTRDHANSIHYSEDEDAYTVSDLAEDAFVKVTRAGRVVWILGGEHSDFTGDGAVWDAEHGHELLGRDGLLFFSNGAPGEPSTAIEVRLDLEAKTATRVWQYEAGLHAFLYGDVQRLDGGDTLVSFSPSGVVREVDPSGALVRELDWELGGALGYTTELASLYPER